MATGKKFYWLKLSRDFFKRHDIQIIESMENGKDYILFYLKLLVESISHQGELRFSETIPYDEKMLSIITNTNIDIVRSAIKIFTQLKLMEIFDDKTIYMSETTKMLGFETDWAKKKREYREQKEIEIKDNVPKVSPPSPHNVRQEIDIELDIELDIEKEKDIIESKDSLSVFTDLEVEKKQKNERIDFKFITNYWNAKSQLTRITKITDLRKVNVMARINEFGLESVFKMIDNVSRSPFLKGENNRQWVATFDWCFKPKNFVKVVEGNFLENGKNGNGETDIERRVRRANEAMGVDYE